MVKYKYFPTTKGFSYEESAGVYLACVRNIRTLYKFPLKVRSEIF
jgi:hypothetical protein